MNRLFTLTIAVLFCLGAIGQMPASTQRALENLVGSTWVGNGAWSDGKKFHQEITIEKSLDGKIFIVKTNGNVSTEGDSQGQRSHGVRAWDSKLGATKFWEFDVFGGITEGTVVVEGNDIFYIYEYEGEILTDAWIYKNENTYEFIVGIRLGDERGDVYCNGGFRRN